MIRENQKILNRIQIVIDLAILVLSLVLAYYIRFYNYTAGGYLTLRYYIYTLYLLVPLYFVLYSFFELYEPKRRKDMVRELSGIVQANIFGLLILMSALFFIKEIDYSRLVFFYFILLNCTLLAAERFVVRRVLYQIRKKGYNKKFVLIIGAGRLGRRIIRKIQEIPALGYEIVGLIDDQQQQGKQVEGVTVIGNSSELESLLAKRTVDEIIIALPLKEYDKLRFIIKVCEKSGVRTNIIPDYSRYIPARPAYDEIDGIPLINIRHVPLDNLFNALAKRVFDIIVSAIGLVLCLPLFLIIALAIKLESPGPVLFKQERVGLNRKVFNMYKFRSMKLQTEEQANTQWTVENDPRVTKVGRFIRKTSLDELPQLFNVLKGDMSLVGPRPERPYFVERFKEKIPKYMIKHQVRPGITGWAQVNGWRGDTSIRKRIEYDLYYIENWTFAFDIKILIMTIFKGFINKNAY